MILQNTKTFVMYCMLMTTLCNNTVIMDLKECYSQLDQIREIGWIHIAQNIQFLLNDVEVLENMIHTMIQPKEERTAQRHCDVDA